MTEREEFEAWAVSILGDNPTWRESGPCELAWLAWQAARSQLSQPQDAKDAARYRWLKNDFSPMGLDIDGNHAWVYRRNFSLKGPNLDSAIDAAMKKT